MKSNSYKRFIIFFLILIEVIVPIKVAQSCGWLDKNDAGYSFLLNILIDKPSAKAPFIMKYLDLIDDEIGVKVHQNENVGEWESRFCKAAKPKDIHWLVFKMSMDQMEVLKTAALSKKIKLSAILNRNSFARHLKRNQCMEVIDYLIFAKKCEPHVVFSGDYWDRPNRDIKEMILLLEEGKAVFLNTKSEYVKLRYAYQIIRLAHYAGKYQEVLRLYDELMPKIQADPSIVNYWIDGHRAGAMKSLGNHIEASYLFAQIFDKCEGKRISAFRSFQINTDEEWEQCQTFCKNDKEKAALFVIRAAEDESKALEEMQEIYDLDPGNIHLKEILINEVRKLESKFLGIDFKRKRGFPRKLTSDAKYIVKLHDFVREIVVDNKIKNLEIWKLTDGYLMFLRGDFYKANLLFEKYQKTITNPKLKKQLDIFKLALKINLLEDVDSEVELEIVEIVKHDYYNEMSDLKTFLFDRLIGLYDNAGRPGKSFRCEYPLEALKPYPKRDIIEDLLEIANDEDRNKIERAFVSIDNDIQTNFLYQMKALDLMSSFQFEAAKEVFRKIERNERPVFKVQLFRDKINSRVHFTPLDTIEYTRFDIIEKMLELDVKGKVALEDGAPYFYKLGLAYYNISYYGHGWKVMDLFRSGLNWGYHNDKNIHIAQGTPFGNKENKDMTKALEYFEKARLLAKNNELAAKAAFMASKCRLNEWYNSKGTKFSYYNRNIPSIPEEYADYYKLLATKYKDTKYYQRVIEECRYFEMYVRKMR